HLVRPDPFRAGSPPGGGPLSAEELGRQRLEPVARRVLEGLAVLDRPAAVEVELDRAAVAVAGPFGRALRAVDPARVLALAVGGVVVDPLPDRAGLERDVGVERVVAGRLDLLRIVGRPARVEAARAGRAGVVADLLVQARLAEDEPDLA